MQLCLIAVHFGWGVASEFLDYLCGIVLERCRGSMCGSCRNDEQSKRTCVQKIFHDLSFEEIKGGKWILRGIKHKWQPLVAIAQKSRFFRYYRWDSSD
jgi:hypothetical protein